MWENIGAMVVAGMIGSAGTYAAVAWTLPAPASAGQETPVAAFLRHYDLDRAANARTADTAVEQLRALNEGIAKLIELEVRNHTETVCLFRVCAGSAAAARGFKVDRAGP